MNLVNLLWLCTGLLRPLQHESSFDYANRCEGAGLLTTMEAYEIRLGGESSFNHCWNGKMWEHPRYHELGLELEIN